MELQWLCTTSQPPLLRCLQQLVRSLHSSQGWVIGSWLQLVNYKYACHALLMERNKCLWGRGGNWRTGQTESEGWGSGDSDLLEEKGWREQSYVEEGKGPTVPSNTERSDLTSGLLWKQRPHPKSETISFTSTFTDALRSGQIICRSGACCTYI